MRLTRRRFGAVVVAGIGATAGCLDGEENEGNDDTDDSDDDGGTTNGDGDTTEFRGHELPPLPHADSTVWYHARDDAPVYVEASAEEVEPPAEVTFSLRNEGDDELGLNPHDWHVYKLHEGDWRLLTARAIPEPWEMVPSGGSVSQTVSFGEGGDVAVGDGVYAFYLGHSDYGAAFEVTGAELILEPTDDVTRTERDGRTLTVYTEAYDEIEDYGTRGTLTVRRGDTADTPAEPPEPTGFPRILPEQAAREDVLRNTLPYFDDETDEVRLKIPTSHRGDLGMLLNGGVYGTRRYFVYEGDEYSVILEDEDG